MANREEFLELAPGYGLGPVCFGMSVDDVERVWGRAAGASVFDGGAEWTLSLHYPGLNLFFDQSEGFRLSDIEVDQECSCRLYGEPLFPRTRHALLDLLGRSLPESNLEEIEEHRDEELEEIALTLPFLQMTFYFDLGEELQGVNWGVLVGSDDKVVWPDAVEP